METASWVIVERATGKAALETFSASVADKVNREKYDVLPILEYLQQLNAAIKAAR
jgi:hypothetical protein